VSAYFKLPARPVLFAPTVAALRAEPSALLTNGMPAIFSTAGAGGNFADLAWYDAISTAADNGTSVWKPDDKGALDPGRWVLFGAETGASTYVRRKIDGTIDGAALSANFLTDAASVVNAGDRPIQALPNTLNFLRVAGVPATFAHQAAAGTVQEALGITREVTAAGAGTVGTGASLAYRTRDGAGTPAFKVIATERAELTAVAGANLSASLVWQTMNVGTLADRMTLDSAGGLRLHAYTTEGFLSTTGTGLGSVATIQPRVLCDGATDITPNARNIGNLATTLAFYYNAAPPASFTRGDVTTNSVLDALVIDRVSTGGMPAVGLGSAILFGGLDSDGLGWADGVYGGRIAVQMTSVTPGATASNLLLGGTLAGVVTLGATLTGAGIFTVTGGFIGPSWDRASAGALAIGPTTATSVAITPATSIAGALTVGSRVDRMTAGALLLGDSTATSVVICDQLTVTNTGERTHTLDASAVDTEQWGTAGVNYIARAADAETTAGNTPTNVWTFAMPDNCAVKFEVHVYCYIIGAAAQRAYFGRRAGYNRDGGAPTEDFDETIHTDKVVGGWGAGPTVNIVAGAPGANDVSVQVTGVAATNVRWITHVEYRVTTTSA
jgi:hypothetical protein